MIEYIPGSGIDPFTVMRIIPAYMSDAEAPDFLIKFLLFILMY
jgi:hypothetical protein